MSNPIIIEVNINSTPEKIWKALTNKEQMKQWYFDITDFELKQNATFNFYEPGNEMKFHHRCTIMEIIQNVKFKHTWTHPSHSKGESILTWELFPAGTKTTVKLTHEGVENFADGGIDFYRENYVVGWNEIVRNLLKKHVESM